MSDMTYSKSIYNALVILMISCPCALVVSIPLTYFGGIGGASKKGILIKGSSFIDSLNKVKCIVFDKTGTLTKGVFKLTKIAPFNSLSEEELLSTAVEIEKQSNHPIALAVASIVPIDTSCSRHCEDPSCLTPEAIHSPYSQNSTLHSPPSTLKDFQELPGQGLSATLNEKPILAGNAKLMTSHQINFTEAQETGTIVYVAIDSVYAGYLVISDELKDDTTQAIANLKNLHINSLHLLTGDNENIAKDMANKLGLSYHANLLPEEKVRELESIIAQNKKDEKTIFVGDGINDAPVLALADIGISMGNLGSDAAIETADVIIMNDSLNKIPELLNISKRTRNIIIQNVCFALGIKLMFVILGFFGVATMWEAVFADVGVTLIAVFNAGRIMRT
jgi:Cd2+/Zn2+-exporting ATPase